MSTPILPLRQVALAVALLSAPAAVAQDTYFWNAASSTDWTATNAWQLNSTSGPAATWVNGNQAVFDGGSGTVAVSTGVVATGVEFAYPASIAVFSPVGSGGSLTLTGAGTITMTNGVQAYISAPIGGGTVSVVKNTAAAHTSGVLQLGGANTFTGNLVIGAGGSFSDEMLTVRLESGTASPSTAAVQFAGHNAALSFHLVPPTYALPNDIQLNTSGSTGSFGNFMRASEPRNVTLNGVISGTGGLTFDVESLAGSGAVFRLTGANTYSGGTSVRSMTVLFNNPLNGNDSAAGANGVSVSPGTSGVIARVGGTGRIGGALVGGGVGLSVGSGGRVAPGDPLVNGGVGQLRVTNDINLIALGIYEVQLGGLTDTDADRDQLRSDGTIRFDTANGHFKLEVSKVGNVTFTPGQTYTYRIAQANSGITMFGGFNPANIDIVPSFGSASEFSVSYEDGAGTENYMVLNYTPVPEPASVLGVCAAFVGVGGVVRRLASVRFRT